MQGRTRTLWSLLFIQVGALLSCSPASDLSESRGVTRHLIERWTSVASFGDPEYAVVDPRDSTVYVVDRLLSSVVVVGPDGDVLATWGRPGDGPGEFRRVERIGLMAGRVWVFDTALRRVTWFTTDGSVVGTKAFEEGPIGWTPWRIAGGLPFARGRYLGVPRASSGEISHPLDTWPLTILVDSGPMIERELALGAPVTAAIERSDGSPWPVLSPQLLPVTPLAEVVPSDQTREVVFVEPRPIPGEAKFRVNWVDSTGTPVASAAIPFSPKPVDLVLDSIRGAYREWAKAQDGIPIFTEDAYLEAQWLPSAVPPVSAIVPTKGGVWLRRERFLVPTEWDFVSRETQEVEASVDLPPSARILASAGRSVWAVTTGSTGEPQLRRFDLSETPHR